MSFYEKLKNKKVIIGTSTFIIISLGVGVFIYNKNNSNSDDLLTTENYIETYTIAGNEKIFVNGVITPTQSQDFNPNIEQISKLNVTNGKIVKKGDLLYTIKDQAILDEIDGLKDQVNALKKSNTTNDPMINTEISKLNAQISSLDKKAYVNTTAPFSGKVYLNEQSNNIEQTSYITLISNEFYMKGQASEQDLPKLQIDDVVDVLIFANNKNLEGRISFVSDRPSTDAGNMNMGGQGNLSYYDIQISFENQEDLVNGFHVQGSIEIKDSIVKIPTSSILENENEYYVFEDFNGILKKRVVEFSEQNDEFTTVTSGLEKNASIVRYPTLEMQEGDLLDPNSSEVDNADIPLSEDKLETDTSTEGAE